MFLTGKLLSFATQPLAWAIMLLAAGLAANKRWPTAGRKLCATALAILMLTGWQAPPDALLHYLESQSAPPDPKASLDKFAGIIVLGGALERAALWKYPGRIALKGEAERMIVPVGLLGRHPHLKLLFTGGGDTVELEALTEADRARIFFDSMNVDPARVLYEAKSRTTYENAIFGAQVPGIDIHQPWLLLTTAAHMPRSLGVFQKAGWNVTPYGVDYRTGDGIAWMGYSLELGAQKWHYALHEIIGYWAYKFTGKL